ncbi:MAG: hypothetical protein WCK06_07805 [Actinomycetota bacterium]
MFARSQFLGSLLTPALLAGALAWALTSYAEAEVAQAAKRTVPQGFFGATSGKPMTRFDFDLAREFGVMASNGVESTRTGFFWSDLQPYATMADVPAAEAAKFRAVAGVPTDFSFTDRFVTAAAQHAIEVLPVVVTTPAWARRDPLRGNSAPTGTANYARFVGALVDRYGPNGSLWREQPGLRRVPVRDWQIWNEPDHDYYWHEQPFQRDYVRLLRAARTTIKRKDPGAKIVLAGLAGRSWDVLGRIYAAGGRGKFDAVAIHPYTLRVSNVMRIMEFVQAALKRNRDAARPVWITELSWPAAKGKVTNSYGFEATEAGAAANLRAVYPKLVARRGELGIARVYWENWISDDRDPNLSWDWAGLRQYRAAGSRDKPALAALRAIARHYEGCAKSTVATRCR